MPADNLSGQVDVSGHHRGNNPVADHHVQEGHVIAGGGGEEYDDGRENTPDPAAKQRQNTQQKEGDQKGPYQLNCT